MERDEGVLDILLESFGDEVYRWIFVVLLFLFLVLVGLLYGYDIGVILGVVVLIVLSIFSGIDWYELMLL